MFYRNLHSCSHRASSNPQQIRHPFIGRNFAKIPAVITYDKYVELISKKLVSKRIMRPEEIDELLEYELQQPTNCPHCQRTIRSSITPASHHARFSRLRLDGKILLTVTPIMITYGRYTELVAKMVTNKAELSLIEIHQIREFENEQPLVCPYCNGVVRTSFDPPRIMHDVEACKRVAIKR